MKRISVSPCMDSMAAVMSFVEDALADVPVKAAMQAQIAVDEIFANIVLYSGAGEASVDCTTEDGEITLRFTDDGIEYNPLDKPDPDITLSAEERDIGGLGVYMVKKSMDSVKYEYSNGKNILVLKKKY